MAQKVAKYILVYLTFELISNDIRKGLLQNEYTNARTYKLVSRKEVPPELPWAKTFTYQIHILKDSSIVVYSPCFKLSGYSGKCLRA